MAKHKSGELRCPATALIAYAKCSFSHDMAHYLNMKNKKISIFMQYESGDIFAAFICTYRIVRENGLAV